VAFVVAAVGVGKATMVLLSSMNSQSNACREDILRGRRPWSSCESPTNHSRTDRLSLAWYSGNDGYQLRSLADCF
jgi:hypothetical protein